MVRSTSHVRPTRFLLKDKAYSEIKRQIQEARFAPGSFLSERQLAGMLGMSKTPIKAALERLEQEGFVSVSPQQGIVVREISIKQVVDQFELRKALETFVARAISGKLSDEHRRLLRGNLEKQRTATTRNSVAKLVELDAEFHLLLCQVLGNDAINDCLAEHRARMHRVIFEVMSQAPGRLRDAVKEHAKILSAVENGQTRQAVKLIEQHLEFGKQYLISR